MTSAGDDVAMMMSASHEHGHARREEDDAGIAQKRVNSRKVEALESVRLRALHCACELPESLAQQSTDLIDLALSDGSLKLGLSAVSLIEAFTKQLEGPDVTIPPPAPFDDPPRHNAKVSLLRDLLEQSSADNARVLSQLDDARKAHRRAYSDLVQKKTPPSLLHAELASWRAKALEHEALNAALSRELEERDEGALTSALTECDRRREENLELQEKNLELRKLLDIKQQARAASPFYVYLKDPANSYADDSAAASSAARKKRNSLQGNSFSVAKEELTYASRVSPQKKTRDVVHTDASLRKYNNSNNHTIAPPTSKRTTRSRKSTRNSPRTLHPP